MDEKHEKSEYGSLLKQLTSLQSRVVKAERRLERLTSESLERVYERAEFIAARHMSMLARVTVATEVFRYLAAAEVPAEQRVQFHERLIAAFDKSDEWWRGRDGYTIKAWIDYLTSNDWGDAVSDDLEEAA